jgi:hypothetical protein
MAALPYTHCSGRVRACCFDVMLSMSLSKVRWFVENGRSGLDVIILLIDRNGMVRFVIDNFYIRVMQDDKIALCGIIYNVRSKEIRYHP